MYVPPITSASLAGSGLENIIWLVLWILSTHSEKKEHKVYNIKKVSISSGICSLITRLLSLSFKYLIVIAIWYDTLLWTPQYVHPYINYPKLDSQCICLKLFSLPMFSNIIAQLTQQLFLKASCHFRPMIYTPQNIHYLDTNRPTILGFIIPTNTPSKKGNSEIRQTKHELWQYILRARWLALSQECSHPASFNQNKTSVNSSKGVLALFHALGIAPWSCVNFVYIKGVILTGWLFDEKSILL